jgi:ABC-type uncharacterized transport system substrate-binding protein
MSLHLPRPAATVLGATGVLLAATAACEAHPHVWVAVETTVVYDSGTFAGLQQRWTFDELYSTMAVEGLDANKDGKLDRAELAELAKVNMEGLKEFEYFTFVRLGDQALAFEAPKDFWMEITETATPPGPAAVVAADPSQAGQPAPSAGFWSKLAGALTGSKSAEPEKAKVLSLVFTLPLQKPVLGEAKGFTFQTSDPTFFIWFDQAKDRPVRFSEGAPATCKAVVADPEKSAADLQKLGESAFGQGGGGAGIAFGTAKVVSASCSKP